MFSMLKASCLSELVDIKKAIEPSDDYMENKKVDFILY